MTKKELAAMTVDELKTLAKKMKMMLPAGAKKAAIVDLLAGREAAQPISRSKVASPVKSRKPAAGKVSTGKKEQELERKRVVREPAVKKPDRSREWKTPAGVEEPLLAQEQVADSKFYTGPEKKAPAQSAQELPHEYNENRIVLMVRDPYWVYAYWEAAPSRIEKEKSWFGWNSKLCVRVYDITGLQFDGKNANGYFDQEVYEQKGNWYFDLSKPTHTFCADLGLLSPEGRFLTLIRSNYITLPRDGASEVLDEEWMLVEEDFWKLYGVPSGSSPQLQEIWKRMRMHGVTSPGMFSREKAKRK